MIFHFFRIILLKFCHIHFTFLNNRMMQILEYFDDKPDDSANWGIAISSLDELKDDSDENESHRLDSDAIQNESKNISGAERKKLESTERKVIKKIFR